MYRLVISKLLNLEYRIFKKEKSEFINSYLRLRLKKYPFWAHGHLLLAQESYLNNDLQLAYGSAHAVMKLTKEESYLKLAKHVLARCYLGSGAEKRAIPLFEELLAKDPSNTFMKEDLAAAYYACEEPAKCREILESIEYDKLTQAGKSVLLSLQRQEGEGQTFH